MIPVSVAAVDLAAAGSLIPVVARIRRVAVGNILTKIDILFEIDLEGFLSPLIAFILCVGAILSACLSKAHYDNVKAKTKTVRIAYIASAPPKHGDVGSGYVPP